MSEERPEILAARERLKAKMGGVADRTGGKGSARRKKKATHKSAGTDDKKLQGTLKRIGVNPIQGIQEVNMFTSDGNVIQFAKPRVQAAIQSNTFVISGENATKRLEDVLTPEMLSQLDASALQSLQQQFQAMTAAAQKASGAAAPSDEALPDLVENFEEVSEN